jgi:dihydroneopterin aldolase
MDTVFIQGLRAAAVIGVHDWERLVRQEVVIDLDMANDNRLAAADDALEHTLDYSAISERVIALVAASNCLLIERLAEQVAERLLDEFAIPWLRLRLRKPGAVTAADSVGVVIERGSRP